MALAPAPRTRPLDPRDAHAIRFDGVSKPRARRQGVLSPEVRSTTSKRACPFRSGGCALIPYYQEGCKWTGLL